MKLEFSQYAFQKYSNTILNENPSSGSRAVPCGDRQTGMTKLMVVFAILRKRLKIQKSNVRSNSIFSKTVQTGAGPHPSSYSKGTGVLSRG